MPKPREITDAAVDLALHNLSEPAGDWRSLIPPDDLGSMVDAGSGQIGLQALVASLQFGPRSEAVKKLNAYADLCPKRWMLSEPWSWIYGKAIVCCWAATVVIAERIGDRDLAKRYRNLLERWAGICALMSVDGRVVMAGARGWGHEIDGGGWDDLWAVACGKEPNGPNHRKYGTPGAYDDWGWLNRCAYVARDVLRAAASPYIGRDWRSLLPSILRVGARTEFQFLGWEDGSRLCIMGDDEPGFDDEDQNSNTPGLLAAGVLGGRVISLPKWPDPASGVTRLRQTNVQADIDGEPEHGWTLFHSHLGEKKIGHGYTTSLPPYTASPLAFHVHCPAGETVWKILHPSSVLRDPVPNSGPVVPVPGTPPARPKKKWKCPCSKLWRRLRGKR